MTHIPGVSLWGIRGDVDPGRRAELDRVLGRHLRAINDIAGSSFGLLAPSATRHTTWRAAFEELFESVLADGERRSVALPVPYDVVRSCFSSAAHVLDDVVEPRLVYWDLWDGNVLVDPVSHALTGMLDLERAMWGDPLIEGQFDPAESSAALLSAYGGELLRTPEERRRRALYTLYLHLIMSIEGTYRRYPEDPVGDWGRSRLAGDVERVNRSSR
jgi:aminoglycoside phosphotransferase (APT) family kinase protein